MKILYFGTLGWGGTSLQRCEALRRVARVYAVDTRRFVPEVGWGRRPWHSLALRLGAGPLAARVSRELVREARRFEPDWVWVDQGLLVSRAAIEEIRQSSRTRVLHYTPDSLASPGFANRCFREAVGAYDLCITTKPDEPDRYRAWGARRVRFSQQGYDPAIHRPIALSAEARRRFGADVTFVGEHNAARARSLARLARSRLCTLAIYGRRWELGPTAAVLQPLQRGWVYGDDYARALSASKIGLGFLNHDMGDVYTTRSFEIPACGTLLLAERTEAHRALYDEDREAVFFASDEELLEKVEFYLRHEEARDAIAAGGRRRVAGYTWQARMGECVAELGQES